MICLMEIPLRNALPGAFFLMSLFYRKVAVCQDISLLSYIIPKLRALQPCRRQLTGLAGGGKIGLFKLGVSTQTNLWLDLDVVITANLDAMVEQYSDSHLACAKNWAQSGHGGCQSSVMIWKGGKGCQAEYIYRTFDPADVNWPPINQPGVLWGDQEHLTVLRDDGRLAVTHFDPALVQSYKYHCREGLPEGAKVVVFHGDPKPADVSESWFQW